MPDLLPFIYRRDRDIPLDSPDIDGNNDAIEQRYTLAEAAREAAETASGWSSDSADEAAASANAAFDSASAAASSATAASNSAATASNRATAAGNSATLSAAWAEGTEPGGPGTKSAAEHAADAEAAAASVLDNPMTAENDMIIGGPGGDPQRLPGVTAPGKALLTAASESAQRLALGLGSAAIRNALGSTGGLYSRDSILGAVSQAAGVPTGAIVERGSNANGEYVRFADGTQICTHKIAFASLDANGSGSYSDPYYSNAVTWTFPAGFSTAPVVKLQPDANSSLSLQARVVEAYPYRNTTSISESIRCYQITGQSGISSLEIGATAIGRWF